ncbi:prenylated Rab acceptor protein 1 [Drosophila guanche]|uniref:PRA1 family protein n=1 Tax=Drosophila guanche TaxID=7266 RepID=A0A3B0J4Q5_DROGU|nr:prenylated Rab acceptor protein 1 [Drosophila guanche]SPP74533.1 blast:p53 and DNA damage-regulated protein 1 [Drosophila guanche]
MAQTNVDMGGHMQVPPQEGGGRFAFDLNSLPKLQSLPSPLELIQLVRSSMRPWTVFFNVQNFKTAVSMQRLTGRLKRNLSYFQSNYIFVFVVLMIYCLITSPLILFVLGGAALLCHRLRARNTNITVMGNQLTPRQQIIAVNLGATPLLFLVGAGAVLFWTLGASCFVIASHAIFYNIDAIVTEENEGFLAEVV